MSNFIKGIEIVRGGWLRVAGIDTQFDPLLLDPHVNLAERKYIREVLGTTFFDALKAARTANIANYNTAFGALQIMFPSDPALETLFIDGSLFNLIALAVVNQSLSKVHLQTTSSGIQKIQPIGSAPADSSDLRYLKDDLKNDITFLTDEVKDFLCANQEDYIPYGFDPSHYCKDCGNGSEAKETQVQSTFFITY